METKNSIKKRRSSSTSTISASELPSPPPRCDSTTPTDPTRRTTQSLPKRPQLRRIRTSRRWFTPPSSPRHRSPVRDFALDVDTCPQDPDIFEDPETDYYSSAEHIEKSLAEAFNRRMKIGDSTGRTTPRFALGQTKRWLRVLLRTGIWLADSLKHWFCKLSKYPSKGLLVSQTESCSIDGIHPSWTYSRSVPQRDGDTLTRYQIPCRYSSHDKTVDIAQHRPLPGWQRTLVRINSENISNTGKQSIVKEHKPKPILFIHDFPMKVSEQKPLLALQIRTKP